MGVMKYSERKGIMNDKKLTLNGKPVTVEELERQKQIAASQKGVSIKEVSSGNYEMRIRG